MVGNSLRRILQIKNDGAVLVHDAEHQLLLEFFVSVILVSRRQAEQCVLARDLNSDIRPPGHAGRARLLGK